jgi:hypothetical protein
MSVRFPLILPPFGTQGFFQPANTACSLNGLAFFSSVSGLASPLFQSRAAGVPQAVSEATAVIVSATPREWRIPLDSASSARGVGQPAIVT